jgi:hypothetical protein
MSTSSPARFHAAGGVCSLLEARVHWRREGAAAFPSFSPCCGARVLAVAVALALALALAVGVVAGGPEEGVALVCVG